MEIFTIQTDLIDSSKMKTPQNDVVGLLFCLQAYYWLMQDLRKIMIWKIYRKIPLRALAIGLEIDFEEENKHTFMCSCSWASCCRDSCSCCRWNSAMRICRWICCFCFSVRSSCCSCWSHTEGPPVPPPPLPPPDWPVPPTPGGGWPGGESWDTCCCCWWGSTRRSMGMAAGGRRRGSAELMSTEQVRQSQSKWFSPKIVPVS